VGDVFQRILETLGNVTFDLRITGSAGMGMAERLGIPFLQEVVASAEVAHRLYPDARTLLDIGGEDSKLIFFDGKGRADIRMNGNCAGGTGAFIDQMAVLLGVPCNALDALAKKQKHHHPIASRCGVFAKTDIQALMSRGISSEDIAASVFHAVALQTLNTLARGYDPKPMVLFTGGPLTFLPHLRKVLMDVMGITEADVIVPDHPELVSAMGAALNTDVLPFRTSIDQFLEKTLSDNPDAGWRERRERPLFQDDQERAHWKKNRFTRIGRVLLGDLHDSACYLGVDSGSTTTKMVLIDDQGRIALDYYAFNQGDHVGAVEAGFRYFTQTLEEKGVTPRIMGSAATGYGEDYVKTVFDLDMGIVETLAHYKAAQHISPDVSFILDIGGQDMKALFIQNGAVHKIEINEACSSGCGTFLQTFAETLGTPMDRFAESACYARSPCDLGSRCTVFMNSKVKQFFREGADMEDISAGLAYSVIRNCLNKVLKIKDMDELGRKVVVQGGTFLNPSVQRAFELLTGKDVYCPDIAGLMGAYGAALAVKDRAAIQDRDRDKGLSMPDFGGVGGCQKSNIHCNGCSNQCLVTKLHYENGKVFYSGNRCEKIFGTDGKTDKPGFNMTEFKEHLLFERDYGPTGPGVTTIGMPRALNMFENFPFWCTLFTELNFRVVLSSPSSASLYEKGVGTVMSDSICFPAKMVHGHIMDLLDKGVDRIFYPVVVYEKAEQKGQNSYNCPIVTGYPEVIRSAINPANRNGTPFDDPTIAFHDTSLLKKGCFAYFRTLGIKRRHFNQALNKAIEAQKVYRETLWKKTEEIIQESYKHKRPVVILAGRPYHLDRFINHGAPQMLSQLGVDVVTEDGIPPADSLKEVQALTQWAYSNRLYSAGLYAGDFENISIVQLNSFGCGLDAIAIDELSELSKKAGKNLTVVRIDEIESPGAIKLRLRTLVESLKFSHQIPAAGQVERKNLPLFLEKDKKRTILAPYFSRFYSPFVESALRDSGYVFKVLPPPDDESLKIGLKYSNNEICYPAILVVGDLIKAIQKGKYSPSQIAVGITQTGAQCRASNYVTLIKKGLIGAGYDIPVVTVHLKSTTLNEQPGFEFDRMDLMKTGLYAIAFADALSLMYHAMIVREQEKGSTWNLVQKYFRIWHADKERSDRKVIDLIRKAVDDFNLLAVKDQSEYPKIGIVGEIYVKYNGYSNYHVVDWLTDQGIEVEVPCLMNFFTQSFVNFKVDKEKYLRKRELYTPLVLYYERKVHRFLRKLDGALEGFRFYRPFPNIHHVADRAAKVLNLANQYGEGWLIPGEIISMVERGVENVLCLQPFGCIANQVVAKGIEKGMRDQYPDLNILFIDLDANTSHANMLNRLHFLVRSAKVSQRFHGIEKRSRLEGF
jgi:predicted CoA-substrate-specific enzyme activase